MAQLAVTINGRSYQIGCEDGQEQHLLGLANYVDARVRELSASVGQVGEARLLVMVSLLIADELAEASGRVQDLQTAASGSSAIEAEAATAERLERAARHLDSLAARLEAG
ncbi:cell division protein ZapA [Algihabitans albus]|uniref:cell division protein ZapA n=1 Tax=Algihabitans albus TaxID=2164067 RepID=UPI0035D005DE